MIIGITGASGFLAHRFIALAQAKGHELVGFSRHPSKPIPGCREVRGFGECMDVDGCEALLHLAGESVFGLWTAAKKERILRSRVEGTRHLVRAIQLAKEPPKTLVSGSAIGFYGDSGQRPLDEESPAGGGFLAHVAERWENEALQAQTLGLRVVLLRTSVVLGKGGGAMGLLAPLFKAGLGGRLGNGQQWFSWIHVDDWAALALFALENSSLAGPLNASAPEPVQNREFTKALAKVAHRPAWLHAPAFLIRAFLGEFSGELLESKRVLPQKALASGFNYLYPEITQALQACV